MKPALPLFDAAAAYDALNAQHQRELGLMALALGCATANLDDDDDDGIPSPTCRASETAHSQLSRDLAYIYQALHPGRAAPDLNQLGIRACAGCGCTDAYGCLEGCSWSGPMLCSRCARATP